MSTEQSTQSTGKKSLLKQSSSMALGSMVSRVLGLVRMTLLGAVLGTNSPQADIFLLGLLIPQLLYQLIGGGTLSIILIPAIVKAIHNDRDGGQATIQRITTLFLTVSIAITATCMLGIRLLLPLLVDKKFLAPQMEAHYNSIVLLSLLTFPQIIFSAFTVIAGQVLNAKDYFGPMMWAPVANNVVQLGLFTAYYLFFTSSDPTAPFTTTQVLVLGLGTTTAMIAQAAWLLPYLKRAGISLRPRFDFRGAGLAVTFGAARWSLLGLVVEQIAVTIIMRFASAGATGGKPAAGVAVYNNANLVWMVFYGVIIVSLITAAMPKLSRHVAAGDLAGAEQETIRTLILSNTFIVPISLGLALCAVPVTWQVFAFGRGAAGVPAIAWTLAAFCIGLPAYTAASIIFRTYYALEKTLAAFWLDVFHAVVNIAIAFALVTAIGDHTNWLAPSLAFAFSGSQILTMMVGFRSLSKVMPKVTLSDHLRNTVRLLVASVPAVAAAYVITHFGSQLFTDSPILLRWFIQLFVLGFALAVALPIFYGLARVVHIAEVENIVRTFLRRGRPAETLQEEADAVDMGLGTGTMSPFDTGTMPVIDTGHIPILNDQTLRAMDRQRRIVEPKDWSDTLSPDLSVNAVMDHLEPAELYQGLVLENRYQLETQLVRRGSTLTWKAVDLSLSRFVLLHIFAPGDSRVNKVIDVARRVASTADDRLLRVQDALISTDPELYSCFLVCEYAPGTSLESLLINGPLSAVEAGWITREVASAMSYCHSEGLFHERLSPDTIIITSTGNIKIVGLLIDKMLLPRTNDTGLSDQQRQDLDVRDIGKLLYAAMVCRWPGGGRPELPDAEISPWATNGDHWLTPRQVRPGVSPSLDRIADRIINRPPYCRDLPLTDASEIVNGLTRVLGAADASSELERRIRHTLLPESPLPQAITWPAQGSQAGGSAWRPQASPSTPASRWAPRSAPVTAATPVHPEEDSDNHPVVRVPVSAAEARRASGSRPSTRRPGMMIFLGVVILTLVMSLGIVVYRLIKDRDNSTHSKPTSITAPGENPANPNAPKKITITGGQDFDPEGSKQENPDLIGYAFDGNPDTAWPTEVYNTATFSKKKSGVGIWVDLGSMAQIKQLSLTMTGPTNISIRTPKNPAATTAPTDKIASWEQVATMKDAQTGKVDVQLPEGTKTRFVLIWLTSLPQIENGGFQTAINEIEVLR